MTSYLQPFCKQILIVWRPCLLQYAKIIFFLHLASSSRILANKNKLICAHSACILTTLVLRQNMHCVITDYANHTTSTLHHSLHFAVCLACIAHLESTWLCVDALHYFAYLFYSIHSSFVSLHKYYLSKFYNGLHWNSWKHTKTGEGVVCSK